MNIQEKLALAWPNPGHAGPQQHDLRPCLGPNRDAGKILDQRFRHRLRRSQIGKFNRSPSEDCENTRDEFEIFLLHHGF